jgi:DNA-directed RNA polymerase specialized sigma24 family protein
MKLYFRRRIGMDCEAALQESFLELLEGMRSGALQNPYDLRSYLCSIMARKCKITSHKPPQLELDRSPAEVMGFGVVGNRFKQIERAAKRRCITDALDRLPIQMQILIQKCFVEEKSDEQVMLELGMMDPHFSLLKRSAKFQLFEEVGRIQSIQILRKRVDLEQDSPLEMRTKVGMFWDSPTTWVAEDSNQTDNRFSGQLQRKAL